MENHKKYALLLLLFMWSIVGHAQFYNLGVDPASIKWKQLKSDQRRVIFPDYYEDKAKLVDRYLDTLTPYVTYNLSDNISKIDIILHPTNRYSNGLVTWAPKRMELSTPPPVSSYSTSWLKQLVAHEYRHVVQISNLNVGMTRTFGYLVGDMSVGAVTALIPTWFFEGDATLMETQLSMNGRGEQPHFSIGLRALLNENKTLKKTTYGKWYMGSYKDYTPSIYEFGYFMTAASYRYYGDDFWETILRYTGRNPYLVVSDDVAAKKFYNTSSRKLFRRTMDELRQLWSEESQKPNSSTLLDVPIKSHTKYASAQHLSDDLIIAQKQGFSDIDQVVIYDKRSSKEERLKYTPFISDKIIIKDSSIYWSEYKPSLFWEQGVGSVVKKADIYEKKGRIHMSRPRTIFKSPNSVYVTPMDGDRYALVSYDAENNPSIELFDKDFKKLKSFKFEGQLNSFNGLAYDDKTSKLCYILIGNKGITLETIDVVSDKRDTICGPTYMTLTNLSAKNGRVFFGSTESGKDEVHMFDLESNEQYQITSSQYGSFAGIGGDSSKIALSTYTSDGYVLAEQHFNVDTLRKVDSKLKQPNKKLVVAVKDWGLPKLDTLNISVESTQAKNVKKYNKTTHLINAHSWVPLVLDVDKLIDDFQFDEFGVGVTGIFQNALSSMTGSVGYGWIPATNMSLVTASMEYAALPVHIGLGLNYGGKKQEVHGVASGIAYDSEIKKYLSVDLDLSLPMNFSGGNNYRMLEPFVKLSLVNSKVVDILGGTVFENSTKIRYGVSYSSFRPIAYKDVAPRWGYSLLVNGTSNPIQKDFGNIVNFYSKWYLPGLFKHHSLGITAAYQYQFIGEYNHIQELAFPRGNNLLGVTEQTFSTAVNYTLPIANPDFIIPSVLNIRRIYFDAFAEYARCDYLSSKLDNNKNVHTVGGEMFFKFNLLGISVFDFTFGLSVYKPSQYNNVKLGTRFSMSF